MKKQLLLVLCILFALTPLLSTQAQDKPRKDVTIQGKAVAKTRGDNPNIKMGIPTVDNPVPKPAKTRGDLCRVYFDNYTGLYVEIYVDGNYKGTMAPWSDMYVRVYSGYTTIYCVSTGGTREWNANGNCDGTYYYKIQ